MATENPFEQEGRKLPSLLNVLTILSLIGCAFQLFAIPISKAMMGMASKVMDNPEVVEKMSDKDLADMEKGRQAYDMMMQNETALWIMTLISVALCVYGILRMRKLKKEGFYFYAIGEVLPVIGGIILLGFSNQFAGASNYFFNLGIPAIFIGLYFTQLKYMK
jgi:hypothetical protein